MEASSPCYALSLIIFLFFFFFFPQESLSQHTYVGNTSCSIDDTSMPKEFLCNDSIYSCGFYYVTSKSLPYSYGFFSQHNITLGNNILFSSKIYCECFGPSFKTLIDYTIKSGDSYEKLVNDYYQGLTTCSALRSQNHNFIIDNISSIDRKIVVPLRCACPTKVQEANEIESLAMYVLQPNDTIGSIARNFGVEKESILKANNLSNSSHIYPFTPILVPLGMEDIGRIFYSGGHIRSFLSLIETILIIIAIATGGVLVLLGCFFCGCKGHQLLSKKRRRKLGQKKFFKQNGGLLLQEKLLEDSERVKIFTQEELELATDNYSESRFLGQGGYGTVYKGILHDNTVVAIKRSKQIESNWTEQFINEVIVLSQINHRNIVRLLGCCLETEFPLLVYEFLSNGTLSHHIQKEDLEESLSLSWDNRLNIASEVAGAISYMHFAASIPIFHRDIKSSNILLDDNYSAKVSDFGTSRFVSCDQTHLTTKVMGTFGHIDPEYFSSSQYTAKSDVYSFGVLMVELLTGKLPVTFAKKDGRNLLDHFISLERSNRLFEILDVTIAKEERMEVVNNVATLAINCLKSNGKERPTMKQVYLELERLRKSQNFLENIEESRSRTFSLVSFESSDDELPR